jgi:6-pyruvoyltetrahydropterin/6-carboxytetrahydropterin synthase
MTGSSHVTVTRSFTFDAAHVLSWHPGKCSRLHGHTYRLEVSVTGPLDSNGVVVDFGEIKKTVAAAVLEPLDHSLLNDTVDNPTAERLAVHILGELQQAGLSPSAVRLWETADCSAEVRP